MVWRRGNVVCYRVPASVSIGIIDRLFAEVSRHANQIRGDFGLLGDVSAAARPSQPIIDRVKEHYLQLEPRHVAIVTGNGTLLNLLAGFILARTMPRGSYTIHQDADTAWQRLTKAGVGL